jgi:hypothetical protein
MVEKDVLRKLNECVAQLEAKIRQLEETVAWQEMEINRLKNEGNTKTFLRETFRQTPPVYENISPRCLKCGIEFSGPMGYVCPNLDCPIR